MSYILEALRRSQAERERGQIPGLNAQPSALAALPTQRDAPPWRWLLPAGLTGLALVALAAWFWRAPAAPASPPPAAVVAATPAPAVAASPAPLPVVVSAPPSPSPSPVTAPTPAPAPAPAPATTPTAAATPAPAAAALPSAATPAPRAVRLADLNAEQRRELPPLNMGGSVWSESSLSRFVIVNGQVMREGDTVAPGVTVDRIGPKAVWLRWRELRLEVPI
jgi:general secretion pathway protein B